MVDSDLVYFGLRYYVPTSRVTLRACTRRDQYDRFSQCDDATVVTTCQPDDGVFVDEQS